MPEEEKKSPLELVSEKFTKANMYAAMKSLPSGDEFLVAFEALLEAIKPQKGGGASSNPMQVIDGVNYHYCRFKDDYVVEKEMNMTNGKSKGTSILASKVAYRIGRAVEALRADALSAFIKGDYAVGAEKNAEADALEKTVEDKATFTDDAMAESIYNPNFGKEIAEESQDIDQNQNENTAQAVELI